VLVGQGGGGGVARAGEDLVHEGVLNDDAVIHDQCAPADTGDGGQVVRHHQQGWGGHGAGTSWGGHGVGASRGGLRLATHAGLCGGLLLIAGGGVGVGLDVGEQVEGLAAQGGAGSTFLTQGETKPVLGKNTLLGG